MQDSGTGLTNTRRLSRAGHTTLGHLVFVSGFHSEPTPSPLVLNWIGPCQGPRSSGPCGTQVTSIGSAKGRSLPCLCHTPGTGPTSRLCLHCPGVTVCVAGCLRQAQSHCAGMVSSPHPVTETVDSAVGWVSIFLLPNQAGGTCVPCACGWRPGLRASWTASWDGLGCKHRAADRPELAQTQQ